MQISIIIPTKNRKLKLNRVIKALEKQNFKKFEVVVINDGEEKLVIKSSINLKIYTSGGRGVAAARNIGINNAMGEIIIFMGDDTYPTANFVREHFLFHKNNTDINVAMVGIVKWYKKLKDDLIYRFLDKGIQFDFNSLSEGVETDIYHFYTANLSIKKSFMELFNENMSQPFYEDIELASRLLIKKLILIFNPKAIVEHDHYYNEKLLIERAFKMGKAYRKIKNITHSKKHGYKFTFYDTAKLMILNLFKNFNRYKMRYYHYLYVSNFLKGYEHD